MPKSKRKREDGDDEEQEQSRSAAGAVADAGAGASSASGGRKLPPQQAQMMSLFEAAAAAGANDELSAGASSASVANLEAESKRQKNAIDSIVKEYSCPLSLELPVEPVIAEDGRTYNRADIQKHIDTACDPDVRYDEYHKLRSPVTNQRMGPKLVPAVQVQNMIRALVESGAVDGEAAEQWKKVDEKKTKANNGDPWAMCKLSYWYYCGSNGLVQDLELSYSWVEKSANLGTIKAKAAMGYMLYTGQGTRQRCAAGALQLGLAAAKGSSHAAYYLADLHYQGGNVEEGYFEKDMAKAKFWLDEAMRLSEEGDACKFDADELEVAESLRKELVDEEEEEDNNVS